MGEQTSLWQSQQPASLFAELCNALYEREISRLAEAALPTAVLQRRMQSLPHYIKRLALLMTSIENPLTLDSQNGSWSAKQSTQLPLSQQQHEQVWSWYFTEHIPYGLVVPVALPDRIMLDCIDRVDLVHQRLRTNGFGWFDQTVQIKPSFGQVKLLKPNKKVLMAACAGHCWRNDARQRPTIPSLRELLLSCDINWKRFNTAKKHPQLS